MRAMAAAVAILAGLWIGAAGAETRIVDTPGNGPAILRAGPDTLYLPVRGVAEGTRVTLIQWSQQDAGDWGLVETAAGLAGWMPARHLTPPDRYATLPPAPTAAPPAVPYTSVVWTAGGRLNLRAGPGPDHPVRSAMPRGAWVEVLARQGAWVQLRSDDGAEGWAHGAYLTR